MILADLIYIRYLRWRNARINRQIARLDAHNEYLRQQIKAVREGTA